MASPNSLLPSSDEAPTAGFLVIGDEILSGRTKDKNIGFVADFLTGMGIDLEEVRIVSDRHEAIVEAVNALRARYAYVFTSGGIGPTHDDITADAISAAFGVPCTHNPEAMRILGAHYAATDLEFTDARKRMARTPQGADLIENAVSKAPGFRMENVHVMAGVPKIMQAMMDAIAPTLRGGVPMASQTVDCPFGEGTIGAPLTIIQGDYPNTMIGSYPRYNDGSYSTQIVIRSRDDEALQKATRAVEDMVAGLTG
ncbi:MAG: competence/damage-inducible protein A [Pseudomonadota bacterium]